MLALAARAVYHFLVKSKGSGAAHPSLAICYNVLGWPEDDGWVALALDMSIWGHGKTFVEAVADLEELVEMQVSHAMQNGKPELIWRRAEEKYWALFRREVGRQLAHTENQGKYAVGSRPLRRDQQAGDFSAAHA